MAKKTVRPFNVTIPLTHAQRTAQQKFSLPSAKVNIVYTKGLYMPMFEICGLIHPLSTVEPNVTLLWKVTLMLELEQCTAYLLIS